MTSATATTSEAVARARAYYDSDDADRFYSIVWGGEDIHIGIYETASEPIAAASHRTVKHMVAKLVAAGVRIGPDTRVLDLGSGYCGAARHLVKAHGVAVTAVNLSTVENDRARTLNQAAGLAERITVHDGSFEELPFSAGAFDVVWSQDAILHSERRRRVLAEAQRVLRPGGSFVFTDPMQSDHCPDGVLQPILERIHLSSLGSPAFYRRTALEVGFASADYEDLTPQLVRHYTRVLEETSARDRELEGKVSRPYRQRMKAGLQHWIDGGRAGHLAWGVFHLQQA